MFASAGDGRSGHERAHDPCRADWKELTAEPVEPTSMPWLLPSCVVAFLAVVAIWALTAL
jgi:hypothetical protein